MTIGDVSKVPQNVEAFLRDVCGIDKLGARAKIVKRIGVVRARSCDSGASFEAVKTGRSSGDGPPPQPIVGAKRPRAQTIPEMFGMPKAAKVWDIFSAGFRAVATGKAKVDVKAKARTPPRKDGGGRAARKHALSHRVFGTSFTVDSFKAAKSDPCRRFFLTHYHADHYGGLSKGSMPDGGIVLCTKITAELVHMLLRVPEERIRVLETGSEDGEFVEDTEGVGNGAHVWCFDANHCPGAVVMLFRVEKTGRYILHSGDCRFDLSIFQRHAKLAAVAAAGEIDYLHLDTTYCDPRYVFPHQRDILAEVVQFARRENERTGGRAMFFFGSYTIGKERVAVAVAEALDLHIYTDKRKMSILRCVGIPELQKRLVPRAADARVHIIPMRSLSADGIRGHAERAGLSKKFIGSGRAVLFRPTGWSYRGGVGVRRTMRAVDQSVMMDVAYSEHSSFAELKEFVHFARAARILPTVNARSAEDSKKLQVLLGHSDRALRTVKEP